LQPYIFVINVVVHVQRGGVIIMASNTEFRHLSLVEQLLAETGLCCISMHSFCNVEHVVMF